MPPSGDNANTTGLSRYGTQTTLEQLNIFKLAWNEFLYRLKPERANFTHELGNVARRVGRRCREETLSP